MQIRNELRRLRERRGFAAADLARAAGVARQTIYAIEAGSFVPNTAVALKLARALDEKVEDLFRLETEADPAPATVRAEVLGAVRLGAGQPVQLCRVGKRVIAAPVTPYPVYLPAADGMADADCVRLCDPPEWRRRILVAGCDPGISLLAQELQQAAQVEVVAAPSSSRQALEWLKQGKVHVAGSHLRDAVSGEYNVPLVRRLFPRGGFRW
jgi:putative molybdopterin biosynthesis protein